MGISPFGGLVHEVTVDLVLRPSWENSPPKIDPIQQTTEAPWEVREL